jgi:hypothetical protein
MGKYSHLKGRIGKFKILFKGCIKPPFLLSMIPVMVLIIFTGGITIGLVTAMFNHVAVAVVMSLFFAGVVFTTQAL